MGNVDTVTRTHYCGHIWTIIVLLGSISLSLLLFAQTYTVWSYLFHAFLNHYLIAYKNAVPCLDTVVGMRLNATGVRVFSVRCK